MCRKKLTYEQIKERFEEIGMKLITTEEECIENNLCSLSKFHVIAACGHEVTNCKFSSCMSMGRKKVCGPCGIASMKESHKKLNENIQEGNAYGLNLEGEHIKFIIEVLGMFFKIEQTHDGCAADIAIRPLGFTENKWLPIQLKSTKGPFNENRYKFHIDGDAYDMIYFFTSLSNEKTWIMNGVDIKIKTNITMGKNKSKYDIYVVKKDNLVKKMLECYNSLEKDTLENIQIPISEHVKKEHKYRIIRQTKLYNIKFENPKINQSHFDFIINGFKVQEKVCYKLKNTNYFKSSLHKTRQKKDVPYSKDDNDFYWFNLQDSGTFYLIPESKMIEKKFISYVEQNIIGKTKISFGKKSKWLDEFKFHYDEENINEIISNIFKLF